MHNIAFVPERIGNYVQLGDFHVFLLSYNCRFQYFMHTRIVS
jgi:hypothetical protein